MANPTTESATLEITGTEPEESAAPAAAKVPSQPTAPVESTEPEKSDDLKAAMAELAGHVKTLATPKPEKEPELTEAQKAEYFAIYDPEKGRPDFMKKFWKLNPDATTEEVAEAKEYWKELQTGLIRQATVTSHRLTQREIAELEKRLAPLYDYVSKAQAKEIRSRFDEAYPALADAKFQKIIDLTARGLADKDFPDEVSYFQALAESAAETIKAATGLAEFDLGAAPQQTAKKPPVTTPRLPRTSAGGGGGNGGVSQLTGPRQTASQSSELD